MIRLWLTLALIFTTYSIFAIDNTPIYDPTRPSSYQGEFVAAQTDAMDLTTIYFSKSQRYAVINDALVQEGDTIAGKKIVAIQQYSVTLINQDNVKSTLTLATGIKKAVH